MASLIPLRSTAHILATATATADAVDLLRDFGIAARLVDEQPPLESGQPGLKTYALPSEVYVSPARAMGSLTLREYQVVNLMAGGNTNAEIGAVLGVGEMTIKTHARRLYRKLGVGDRAHAVITALRLGLIGGA